MTTSVRAIMKGDLPHLKKVLQTIDLFPPEMLDEMIANYFHEGDSREIWFTATVKDQPIAIGYCAPEQLTDGTHNLYAIGVRKDYQGKGIGAQMMAYIEQQLREHGQRILIVETSGSAALSLTRAFYEKLQYTKEATIRDFWSDGDDKVIYWKKLT